MYVFSLNSTVCSPIVCVSNIFSNFQCVLVYDIIFSFNLVFLLSLVLLVLYYIWYCFFVPKIRKYVGAGRTALSDWTECIRENWLNILPRNITCVFRNVLLRIWMFLMSRLYKYPHFMKFNKIYILYSNLHKKTGIQYF